MSEVEKNIKIKLAKAMYGLYKLGLTTSTGGNISVISEEGTIFITPAGIDKGSLFEKDIVLVKKTGEIFGEHKPSSELAFHSLIYKSRKDVKAIVHAHSQSLVALSLTHELPDINIFPAIKQIIGKTAYAKYQLTGSIQLGKEIVNSLGEDCNALILENHGALVVGNSLNEAIARYVAFEAFAKSYLLAKKTGLRALPCIKEFDKFNIQDKKKESFPEIEYYFNRAISLNLFRFGTEKISFRNKNKIKTTKSLYLDHNNIFYSPDKLHDFILNDKPNTQYIIEANSEGILAFCLSDTKLNVKTIPESFVVLNNIPVLDFSIMKNPKRITEQLKNSDTVIIRNHGIIVCGKTLFDAFDKLEVAEFTISSYLQANLSGQIFTLTDDQILELKQRFNL